MKPKGVGVKRLATASLAFCALVGLLRIAQANDNDAAAAARRQALMRSYGTYAGNVRTPDQHMDLPRLIDELGD